MLQKEIRSGLQAMQLDASDAQIEQLAAYLELLKKWNKAYNLTAITDPRKMVAYHVLDSLSILDHIPPQGHCLDVGTGAGLPGIPLAIMLPESSWVLLDSNGKKTRFVQQAIAHCGLSHVKVVQSRVEDYHAESSFDVIVSRAYSSLADFMATVEVLWQPNTQLLTMKTELADAESEAVDPSQYQMQTINLQVPGIAQKRSLVIVQRRKS
jgi:16S rRNA (guanine527-N7)-methyltransferase